MLADLLLAQAEKATLVAWWKALLIIPTFLPWAWLVSAKLDKDARFFHLEHRRWNAAHMVAGAGALVAMVLVPIFWVGWPIGIIILLAPIMIYWQIRNRSVPEENRFYLTSEGVKSRMERARQRKADRAAVIRFIGGDGKERPAPQKDEPAFAVHMMAEDLVTPAIDARASRVEIAVDSGGGKVAQTIDGMRYKREAMPTEAAMRLIDYFKETAGLDVKDRRRLQEADFGLNSVGGKVKLALLTSGTSSGQVMRIEFNREKRLHRPFDTLGLLEQQIEGLQTLQPIENRHGIVLIGAPAGHGLTTSTYAFVGRHDAYTSNIKSLERRIFVQIDGLDQLQFDPTNPDVDYATNLQSILRRDPDIVLADEVKDSETARIIAASGVDGPLIYVQQRAGSIVDQIRQWVKQVGDVKKATGGLVAVSNQRLMRSLCPNCRQTYQPTPEQLKKLGLPGDRVKQLHRATGKVQVKNKIDTCPVCAGSGYLGQVGFFEVLMVDEDVRRILASGDLKGALAHARRNKMIYLQEAALSKVLSGESSIDEVMRVMGKTSGNGKAAQPKPAA